MPATSYAKPHGNEGKKKHGEDERKLKMKRGVTQLTVSIGAATRRSYDAAYVTNYEGEGMNRE